MKHFLSSRLRRVSTRFLWIFLLSALLVLLGRSASEVMEVDKLSAGINQFSAQFCKEVDNAKSAVSSPLSAEILLALLALGASGRCHDEILSSLHLSDDDSVRSGFTSISAKLKKVKGVTFSMANKVYLKDSYKLKDKFKTDAEKVFNAEVEKVNFDDGAFAVKIINAWVAGKTNKKITELLSADSVSSETRLVLVNALYFKGSWKHKFDAGETKEGPFHVNAAKTINIPFMHITKSFKYGRNDELNAQLLELPYEGEEASMLIVLPNEVDGLGKVLERLAGGVNLQEIASNMREVKVAVSLPKFKIETEIDLKILLPKLGVKAIFERDQNDLSGLLESSESLFVSEAVQKAFIEVNEEGAEAAAATAAVVTRRIMMPGPEQIVVDRPFVGAVRIHNTFAFFFTVRDIK